MNKILLIYFLLFIGSTIQSQEAFFTKNAYMTIKAEYHGQPVELYSRSLIIKLNYETAFINIKVPVKSLVAENKELQKRINSSHSEILFSGYLGIDFINTEQHPPFKFDFNGQLKIQEQYSLIEGTGELIHIERANRFVCMLGMKWILNLSKLEMKEQLPFLGNQVEVSITYPVLERDGF